MMFMERFVEVLWTSVGPTDFVRGRGQCETIIKTIMLR
jgi:hypothetical protein